MLPIFLSELAKYAAGDIKSIGDLVGVVPGLSIGENTIDAWKIKDETYPNYGHRKDLYEYFNGMLMPVIKSIEDYAAKSKRYASISLTIKGDAVDSTYESEDYKGSMTILARNLVKTPKESVFSVVYGATIAFNEDMDCNLDNAATVKQSINLETADIITEPVVMESIFTNTSSEECHGDEILVRVPAPTKIEYRTFSDTKFNRGSLDIHTYLSESLENAKHASNSSFIKLVEDEFEVIESSDEMAIVMEIVESYKMAISKKGDNKFYWSYTASLGKLKEYIIKGANIVVGKDVFADTHES